VETSCVDLALDQPDIVLDDQDLVRHVVVVPASRLLFGRGRHCRRRATVSASVSAACASVSTVSTIAATVGTSRRWLVRRRNFIVSHSEPRSDLLK
jgi:hypothetical protein